MSKNAKNGMPQTDTKGLVLHADEFGTPYTLELIEWKNVVFDPNKNVRPRDEFDGDKWGAIDLAQKLRGLPRPKTEPAFHFDTKTGELTILRGNRRYLAYEILRAEDPKNVNYQRTEARIYRDLSPTQQAKIKMDHAANELALSEHGLYLSVIECKKMGMSEPETVAFLRGALNATISADRNPTLASDHPDVFKQYRNTIRNHRWANDIACLEREYVNKLKTPGTSFPSQTQVVELHKAFLEDGAKQLLTRDTAESGKTFGPMWRKAIAARDESIRTGTNVRGKTQLTPTKIKAFAFSSVINNAIKKCVDMTAKNPSAWTDVIDPLLVKLEAFMTKEDRAILERECGSAEEAPAAPAAPVVEAPVAPVAEKPVRGKVRANKSAASK